MIEAHGWFRRALRPRNAAAALGHARRKRDQPPIVLSDANIALAFDAELVPYAEAAIRLAVLPVL